MKANDPVYPQNELMSDEDAGITVRDHIAIQAMQGHLCAHVTGPKTIAEYAYSMADAMIEQSNKG